MRKANMVMVLAAAAAFAAAATWGQAAQITSVPIQGQYYEPALGGPLAYSGAVYLMWVSGEARSGSMTLARTLVATAYPVLSSGPVFELRGFSEDRIAAAPGDTVDIAQVFWGLDSSRARSFQSSLKATAVMPGNDAIAFNGAAACCVGVPISGRYYEKALGDVVSYAGTLHMFWIPPAAGSANLGWSVIGALSANAYTLGGRTFAYHGVCEDCIDFTADASGKMAKLFWAVDKKGKPVFQGTVTVALRLPADAPFPDVDEIAFAEK